MANTNTFSAVYNLTQGNVTAETAFAALAPLGGSTAAFGSGTTRAIVEVTSLIFDGRPFRVRAAWKGTSNGATNLTVAVRYNSAANTNLTTFTGDTLLMTSGLQAQASGSTSGFISSLCIWDATSQRLAAASEPTLGNIATPVTIPTANSGAVTISATSPVASSLTAVTSLQFFATAIFSASQTGNTVTLTELAIDQI